MNSRSPRSELLATAFAPPLGAVLGARRLGAPAVGGRRAPAPTPRSACPPGRSAVLRRSPPSATASGGAAAEAESLAAATVAAATEAVTTSPSSSGLLQEPGVAAPGAIGTEEQEDRDEESVLHRSWYIYEQPGNPCVVCSGQGANKCLHCYGNGYLLIGPDAERDREECPMCKGAKKDMCRRCLGSGVRPSTSWNEAGEEVPNLTNEQVCALAAEEAAAYLASGGSVESEAEGVKASAEAEA